MKKVVCSLLIMFILLSEFTACFGATNEVVLSNDVEVNEKKSTEENVDSKNLVENETEIVSNEIKDDEKIENTIEDEENKSDSDMDKGFLEVDEVKDESNKKIEDNDEKSNDDSYKAEDSDAYSNENTDAVIQSIQTQSVGESDKRLVEIDGVWRMVIDDEIIYDYTGVGENENGMWYMENGDISYKYNGTWFEEENAYVIENSKVQIIVAKDTTRLIEVNPNVWRMIVNGKVVYNYTGLGENDYGVWYLENGYISYRYTGTYTDGDGITYFIENNRLIGTKLVEINGIWRMVVDGKIIYNYTGVGQNKNGKWYLENGDISYKYNGTWFDGDKAYIIENSKVQLEVKKDTTALMEIGKDNWRMIVNGKVAYNYTGLGENNYGVWYLENGYISYEYTGTYTDGDGITYFIENNRLIGTKLVEINDIWRMVVNGRIIYDYTGVGQNENGKWYLENGDISYKYNGTWFDGDKAYIIENSKVQLEVKKDTTALMETSKDNWRMIVDGKIIYDYTGVGQNENGKWYLENGDISYKYNGTWFNGEKAYIIENSKVQLEVRKDTTRLLEINNNWRMVIDGKIVYDYTGLGENDYGIWYLENGDISYDYDGIVRKDNDDYVIEKSRAITEVTRLKYINDTWYMVINGKINYKYTGLCENDYGMWYMQDGELPYTYNGTIYDGDNAYLIEKNYVEMVVPKDTTKMICIKSVWRMVVNGKIDYDFTGVAENDNGKWYFENGEITYTYNSEYEDTDGITYIIINSKFSGIASRPGYFGKMSLEQPVQGSKYISDSLIVSGWALSSELNDKILVYIDGKYIGEASRENRQDILDEYSEEFGNMYNTELPGYVYDLTGYGLPVGYHIIRIEDVTADGSVVIQSREIGFSITALSKSYGIDVSHYQGEIDWEAVKNSGVTFAILKIGEYWTNSKRIVYDQFFEKNYQACKRLGIAVGGYFYSYAFNRDEGNEEADICLSIIKNKIFELPIFIDVEDKAIKNAVANGKTDVANVTDASLAFCEKIVSAGHQAGVYASRDFFYNYFNIPLIEKYWIWVAHYTSDQTNYTGKYNFWQATSKGSVPGINGNVDIDWFYKR